MIRALDKILRDLGYTDSRKAAARFIIDNDVRENGQAIEDAEQDADHACITINGEALDPLPGFVIMMHKPTGYECTHAEGGPRVYDLLPPRFLRRDPKVVTVGRLDKDASGLLLLTDDGKLVQRLTSPRHHVEKTYEVTLASPLRGDEGQIFARGDLMLHGEDKPLLPARLEVTGANTARLTITEGRYHQVKRMFAATGNRVEALHRPVFGSLRLESLAAGEWRYLTDKEIPLK